MGKTQLPLLLFFNHLFTKEIVRNDKVSRFSLSESTGCKVVVALLRKFIKFLVCMAEIRRLFYHHHTKLTNQSESSCRMQNKYTALRNGRGHDHNEQT